MEGAVDGGQAGCDRGPLARCVLVVTDRWVGLAVEVEIGTLNAAVVRGSRTEPIIGQIRPEEGIVAGVAAEDIGTARANGVLKSART